jgi:hypothetical protein
VTDPSAKLVVPGRQNKRVHVALPLRVTYWDNEGRPCLEMACTYDISSRGARVTGLRCVKGAGEIIAIERGRNKAFCRVVWVGQPNSELRGQVGLEWVERERTLWEAELREMEESFEPMPRDNRPARPQPGQAAGTPSRRRFPRFEIHGSAELENGSSSGLIEAGLRNLGEMGCLVTTQSMIVPGTSLKVVLNVANYDLAVRGQVRHGALDVGLGIEFREIRKGDRSILQHILRKLAEQEDEEFGFAMAHSAAAGR